MAITISGHNNNDRILASDGVLDSISGFNVVGVMTAAQFDVTGKTTTNHISIGNNIHLGNAGIITATTLLGNVTGNINHESNLLLQISGSEKFRVGNGGQFGIAGANYGTAGQVFTSGGSGSAPTWSTIASDKITEGNTEAEVIDTGSNGYLKVKTEGTERLRITKDGEMLIGTSGSDRLMAGQKFNSSNGWSGAVQIEKQNPTNGNSVVPMLGITAYNGANTPYTGGISFNRSNHNTQGTQGAVTTTQQLGNIAFNGSDGTNFIQGAEIFAIPDQTFTTNDGPASLVFATTPDGNSEDEPQERLRITSGGYIKVSGNQGNQDYWGQLYNRSDGFSFHAADGSVQRNITFYSGASTSTERLRIDSAGQVLPGADDAQNLGSSTKRWANIYAADMHYSNEGGENSVDGTWGSYTIQEGESDLFLLNNRNGKKYKFVLQEVS